MQIDGLDEVDNKILTVLHENARAGYSEIAEEVGLSRVAVKNRIQAMEDTGVIRGYEVKLAPKKAGDSVEFVLSILAKPDNYDYMVSVLAQKSMIRKLQASSGECRIYAFGLAPNAKAVDELYQSIRKVFQYARYIDFDIITSTYKDVDGGIEYERPGEERTEDAGGTGK